MCKPQKDEFEEKKEGDWIAMSDHKKSTENKEQKVVTKYDLKMQKRREQKEKDAKAEKRGKVIGILVAAVILCVAAAFPIYTHMAMNKTVATVGGQEVSQLEFDYYYNVAKSNYYNTYGTYLSYMGLDITGDLSTQMYTDTLSWQDYFEQSAITSISQTRALAAQAEANGFSYDTAGEYKNFQESLKLLAENYGISIRSYVKQVYGPYATTSRIADFVKESILTSAYYAQVQEEKAPAEEAIQAYYEENVDYYDSVDYSLVTVEAELPTEPTELADPVEETTDESQEDAEYEPSQAEIEQAMAEAKKAAEEIADAAEGKTLSGDNVEVKEGQTYFQVTSAIASWLFEAGRKENDITVIEDTTNNCYYVAAFTDRYLDQTPSADIRLIVSGETEGQAILDEWKSGAATEDSFIELCEKYSTDTTASTGGLYQGILSGSLGVTELEEWALDESRAAGDTVAIQPEGDTQHYVLYYVGQGDPSWKQSISSTLLSEYMTEYLEEITANVDVEDPEGNLNYLKVAAQEAAAAEEETGQQSEETDSTDDSAEASTATE